MSSFNINKNNFNKNNNKNNTEKHLNIYSYKIQSFKKIYFDINLTVCIHCYNLEIFNELVFYIQNFFEFKWKRIQIIIHYVNQKLKTIENIIENILKDKLTFEISDCFKFIKGKNIGGDIGGFLQCCNFIKDDDNIVSVIHTKTDKEWRKQMMNIFTKDGIYTSMKLFYNNHVGMIGNLENLEYFLKKYNKQFSLNKYYIPMIKNICELIKFPFNINNLIQSNFVAGTIFMCKKDLLNQIIKNNNSIYDLCLDFDKLYSMNMSRPKNRTYEHAMEIFFGYITYQWKLKLIGLY